MRPKSLLEVAVFLGAEMASHFIEQVHGYTIKELERILQVSCDDLNGDLSLEANILGGWTNINIRGKSDGLTFVLKLPCSVLSFESNPYDQLYETTSHLNNLGIAARPIAKGRLSGKKEIPFIILEYIDGVVYDSLSDLSHEELSSLKDCLEIISKQNPPGLRRYKSPSEHMTTKYTLVKDHVHLSTVSNEVKILIETCENLYPDVLSYTDALGDWPQTFMHGDLWIPNVIFQQDKVRLLDFEDAAYGHHLYDLAYLLETPESASESHALGLIHPEDLDAANELRPVAVAYIINWSLERLLSMESGLIEPNLTTEQSRTAVIGYTRGKINRLKTLLSN